MQVAAFDSQVKEAEREKQMMNENFQVARERLQVRNRVKISMKR